MCATSRCACPEPANLRGTYAGLAHPVTIDYLTRLGITAVELLPVHTFTIEPEVRRRGLINHWATTRSASSPPREVCRRARPTGRPRRVQGHGQNKLHAAGIEVILDVVYNHTAEQSARGATLSWRGLDNRAYYRLDGRGDDIDVTGCGNTVDVRHVVAVRMISTRCATGCRSATSTVPLRPGRRARPRQERRVRPRSPVAHRAAHRPGALAGEEHRRAVGPGHPGLADGAVPPTVL